MSRNQLFILLVVVAVAIFPCQAQGSSVPRSEMIDNAGVAKVSIYINESVLRVTGAAGLVMSIYNITGGMPVMKVRVDSPDKRFDLNLSKGIYIVKVGDAVRKIVVK